MLGRCRTRPAPCSIRCSRCGVGCASHAGQTARIAFWSGVAGGRAEALASADKHRDMAAFDRTKTLAGDASAGAAARTRGGFRRGAAVSTHCQSGAVCRFVAARAARDSRTEISWGRRRLWACGISGDLPIVLVHIDEEKRPRASSSSCCGRMSTGGSSAWRSISSSSTIIPPRMRRNCSRRWMPRSGPPKRAAARRRARSAAASSRFAATRCRSSSRELLQTAARAIFAARLGRLSDQLARLRGAGSRRPGAAAAEPRPTPRFDAPRGLPRARILQRLRRLRRRRARIRHRPRGRPMDPRALDQRHREPTFRLSGIGGWKPAARGR